MGRRVKIRCHSLKHRGTEDTKNFSTQKHIKTPTTNFYLLDIPLIYDRLVATYHKGKGKSLRVIYL